jgi:hypothetical protein
MMNDKRSISVVTPNGSTALPAPVPDGVTVLSARSPSDIWGVGPLGFATHWNGTAWSAELPGWTVSRGDIVKVTGSGPTDLWAGVRDGTLLHGDGSTWQVALTPDKVGGRINDIWARTPDDVWVLGRDGVIHRLQAGAWSVENPAPGSTLEMRVISGNGPNDVWILRGANTLVHFDGMNWLGRQPELQRPVAIWSPGPDELWIVGEDGTLHWYGGSARRQTWPPELGNAPSFSAVAGTGPGDVWVLSSDGYVLRVSDDGSKLVTMGGSGPQRAMGLAPIPTGGIWALYQNGTVGSRFYGYTAVGPANPGPGMFAPAGLNTLWVAPDGTIWAGGAGGTLIRRAPAP